MNTGLTTLLSVSLMLRASGPAFADGRDVIPTSPPPAATPPQVAPGEMPPPPLAGSPAPFVAEGEHLAEPPQQPVSALAGQWVYTTQYGWIWMPHSRSDTYVPAQGIPYMYVYYPAVGWRWIASPWVLGRGPRPFWGTWGVRPFAWYSRPGFHVHEYHAYPRYSFAGHPVWALGHGGGRADRPHVRVGHGHGHP